MQPSNRLALYEERLGALWESLVTTLGIYTVRVLLDRAIWQTAQRHPELALIQRADGGLILAALEQSYATRPAQEIAAAFDDLAAEIVLILTRLLGREVTTLPAEAGSFSGGDARAHGPRWRLTARSKPLYEHGADLVTRQR